MSKSFDDLEDVKAYDTFSNLMLVDGLNLAFRYFHKGQKGFSADYLRTIESLAKSYKCSDIVVCSDIGSSSYRKAIFPDYKGNRAEKFKNQTEEEAEAFQEFIADFESALNLCSKRYPLLRFPKVEADDIIAYIAQQATTPDHIWIISTDRDLDQLISPTVSRFSYVTRKEVTKANFYETYGCTPEQYISIKVLTGDAGDNVPGVNLIGPKRAAGLVQKYGSALDIYDALPLPGKQKTIQYLNEFSEQLLTNYELMDLGFSREALGEYVGEVDEFINAHNL